LSDRQTSTAKFQEMCHWRVTFDKLWMRQCRGVEIAPCARVNIIEMLPDVHAHSELCRPALTSRTQVAYSR